MPRGSLSYEFETDFLTNSAICPPLGEFRLYDGTRVTLYFTPRGLAMRIRAQKDEDTIKISRELIEDNRIKSIFFGSMEMNF